MNAIAAGRVRRVECAGGCGAWWYHPTPEHPTRPVRWCPRCYRKHRTGVNRHLAEPAKPIGRFPKKTPPGVGGVHAAPTSQE